MSYYILKIWVSISPYYIFIVTLYLEIGKTNILANLSRALLVAAGNAELNAPTYQLMPNGKIHYNHPPGTHDDKFWALAVHVAIEKNRSKPMAQN